MDHEGCGGCVVGGVQSSDRIVIAPGKFGVTDLFDVSSLADDPLRAGGFALSKIPNRAKIDWSFGQS